MQNRNLDLEYKLDDLVLVKYLKSIDSPFLGNLSEIYNITKDVLNTRISYVFPNYTLHNIGHSFRVIEYMSQIIDNVEKLDELEVVLLIYAGLLHDVGMAVSESDIELIKNDQYPYCEIKFSAMKKFVGGDEQVALQEYVRRIHGKMSSIYINTELKEKLSIPGQPLLNFAADLGLICESHTHTFDWLKRNLPILEVKGRYHYSSQYIGCLLRLGDILDIDSNRTPPRLYSLIDPKGISDTEWKQHFVISNDKKIEVDNRIFKKKIVLYGKSSNASIHRKILQYISWIGNELLDSITLTHNLSTQYNINFIKDIDFSSIKTEGFSISDHKITLEFKAITHLLMGEHLYGDKTLGLRELIQNSMDACRVREEIEARDYEFGAEKYKPKIKIIIDSNRNSFTIKDNGIGMTSHAIKKYFLSIGKSYYNSSDFILEGLDYRPIGNFGIGFLACFMLSDVVQVRTRSHNTKWKYELELEKGNEYITWKESEDVNFEGTEVVLEYKSVMNAFKELSNFKTFLGLHFLNENIAMELLDKNNKTIDSIKNSILPDKVPEKSILIDLAYYLNDIEGYLLLKPYKKIFINTMADIDFDGILYTYDEENGLMEVEDFELLNLDDYVYNNKIQYLSIPLINSYSNSDMFFTLVEFHDLFDTLERMNEKLERIAILPKKQTYEFNFNSLTELGLGIDILPGLPFHTLADHGHDLACKTLMELKSVNVFEGIKNQLYMPFETNSVIYTNPGNQLFLRNVLIKDSHIDITTFINNIYLEKNENKYII